MTDKKISELTSITGANVSDANDVLPIVDTSVATTKKITRAELFKSVSSVDINGGTIDGTVIGGSTPAAISGTTATFSGAVTGTDLTLSGGVYLGGTGAANYLDDYEEGTWTPAFSRTTAGDFSYTASVSDGGRYIKVGRSVFVIFRINGTFTESTASGAYIITGLPFTSESIQPLIRIMHTSSGNTFDAVVRDSETSIQLLFTPTSGFNYIGGVHYSVP